MRGLKNRRGATMILVGVSLLALVGFAVAALLVTAVMGWQGVGRAAGQAGSIAAAQAQSQRLARAAAAAAVGVPSAFTDVKDSAAGLRAHLAEVLSGVQVQVASAPVLAAMEESARIGERMHKHAQGILAQQQG